MLDGVKWGTAPDDALATPVPGLYYAPDSGWTYDESFAKFWEESMEACAEQFGTDDEIPTTLIEWYIPKDDGTIAISVRENLTEYGFSAVFVKTAPDAEWELGF